MRDKIVSNYSNLLFDTINIEFDKNPIPLLEKLKTIKELTYNFEYKFINATDFLNFNIDTDSYFDKIVHNLFKSGNYRLIDRILVKFKSLCSEKSILKEYLIISAIGLDDIVKKQIENHLKFTANFVIFEYNIDEKILDGIVIKENNEVLDLSLVGKIDQFKDFLKKNY